MKKVNKFHIKYLINNLDKRTHINQYGYKFKFLSNKNGDYLIIDNTEYDITMSYAKKEAINFINDYGCKREECVKNYEILDIANLERYLIKI